MSVYHSLSWLEFFDCKPQTLAALSRREIHLKSLTDFTELGSRLAEGPSKGS